MDKAVGCDHYEMRIDDMWFCDQYEQYGVGIKCEVCGFMAWGYMSRTDDL